MIRKMVSKGNREMQQRLFSFSFRKMSARTFVIDEYRSSVNSMCVSKPVSKALWSRSSTGRVLYISLHDVLFTSIVMVVDMLRQ